MDQRDWTNDICVAMDSKDYEKFVSYFADDGLFRIANAAPVKGHNAIIKHVKAFFAMLTSSDHNFVESDDCITGQGEVNYVQANSNARTITFCDVVYFKKGKITEYIVYVDNNPLFALSDGSD